MPPELPGFYYDEERGHYFPIASGTGPRSGAREYKKRKIKQKEKEATEKIRSRRADITKQIFFNLINPLEQAFGDSDISLYTEGLRIEERSSCDSKWLKTKVDRTFGMAPQHHQIGKYIKCEHAADGNFRLALTTHHLQIESYFHSFYNEDGLGIMELDNYLPEHAESDLDPSIERKEFYTIRFEGSSFKSRGLFCHMAERDRGRHFFIKVKRDQRLERSIRSERFGAHQNVHDSLDLGDIFVIAVGPSLVVSSWENQKGSSLKKFWQSKKNSDILCLAAETSDESAVRLYAGCRDGSIYAIEMSVTEGQEKIVSKKRYEFPDVRSILSLKTTDLEGILFVSAISSDTQILLMLDMFLEPNECKAVLFKTSFSNMTEKDEIFDVSSDGRFLLYGSTTSCDGHGDFELFSSHLGDNVVHERCDGMMTVFPLKTLRNNYAKEDDLKNLRLRAVGLAKVESKRQEFSNGAPGGDSCLEVSESVEAHKLFLVMCSLSSSSSLYLPNMVLKSTDVI